MYEILFLINITRILENIVLDLIRIFKYILNLISNENDVLKSFNIITINLNVLHNYFDVSNKIIFRSLSNYIFTPKCFLLLPVIIE